MHPPALYQALQSFGRDAADIVVNDQELHRVSSWRRSTRPLRCAERMSTQSPPSNQDLEMFPAVSACLDFGVR